MVQCLQCVFGSVHVEAEMVQELGSRELRWGQEDDVRGVWAAPCQQLARVGQLSRFLQTPGHSGTRRLQAGAWSADRWLYQVG